MRTKAVETGVETSKIDLEVPRAFKGLVNRAARRKDMKLRTWIVGALARALWSTGAASEDELREALGDEADEALRP